MSASCSKSCASSGLPVSRYSSAIELLLMLAHKRLKNLHVGGHAWCRRLPPQRYRVLAAAVTEVSARGELERFPCSEWLRAQRLQYRVSCAATSARKWLAAPQEAIGAARPVGERLDLVAGDGGAVRASRAEQGCRARRNQSRRPGARHRRAAGREPLRPSAVRGTGTRSRRSPTWRSGAGNREIQRGGHQRQQPGFAPADQADLLGIDPRVRRQEGKRCANVNYPLPHQRAINPEGVLAEVVIPDVPERALWIGLGAGPRRSSVCSTRTRRSWRRARSGIFAAATWPSGWSRRTRRAAPGGRRSIEPGVQGNAGFRLASPPFRAPIGNRRRPPRRQAVRQAEDAGESFLRGILPAAPTAPPTDGDARPPSLRRGRAQIRHGRDGYWAARRGEAAQRVGIGERNLRLRDGRSVAAFLEPAVEPAVHRLPHRTVVIVPDSNVTCRRRSLAP